MSEMTITSAQYIALDNENNGISAVIEGVTVNVPLDPANRHFVAIMRQVESGDLTIADAD